MTVRRIFYRLVIESATRKTETEYKATVCRLVTELRRTGRLRWGWITDFTRTMRRPKPFEGIEQTIEDMARHYRRSLWQDLDMRVEMWLEKDALAGVLLQGTLRFDVPLMVTQGYSSLTFLHAAGQESAAENKPTAICNFGDWGPSG